MRTPFNNKKKIARELFKWMEKEGLHDYIYIYIKIYILSSACYEMSHYFELASDSTRLHG
jgi:hypothetical protein